MNSSTSSGIQQLDEGEEMLFPQSGHAGTLEEILPPYRLVGLFYQEPKWKSLLQLLGYTVSDDLVTINGEDSRIYLTVYKCINKTKLFLRKVVISFTDREHKLKNKCHGRTEKEEPASHVRHI